VAHHLGGRLFQRAATGELLINQGGRRFVLVHGDRLNRIDYNYRIWNKLVRNVWVRLLLRLLPRSWTLKASAALERKLRTTNRRFRTYFPDAQCEDYARIQFGRGADVVVLGHFHRAHHFIYDEEEGPPGEVYVLPDWLSHRSGIRIRPDGRIGFVHHPDPPTDAEVYS
jgi:UDP-2,3-diacylglucosamine pyrophosphatase LpxH